MILAGQGSFSTIERAPQIRNHSDSSLAVCISSGVRTAAVGQRRSANTSAKDDRVQTEISGSPKFGILRRNVADVRLRASEGFQRPASRRNSCRADASPTSDQMHSRPEGTLKTQRIKSPFSRNWKSCPTRYMRSYSVRCVRRNRGKTIGHTLGSHLLEAQCKQNYGILTRSQPT
jgi:hypothetical protein